MGEVHAEMQGGEILPEKTRAEGNIVQYTHPFYIGIIMFYKNMEAQISVKFAKF